MSTATISPIAMTVEELAARVGAVPLFRVRTDPSPGTASEEDVERLRREEGVLCELIDGVRVEKAGGSKSAFLAVEIARLLGDFSASQRRGGILGADGFVWLLGTQLRAPDVSYSRRDQLADGKLPESGFVDVAPALAAEVFTPGITVKEIERKRNDFLTARSELFWVVDPDRQEIEVSTSPATRRRLRREELLDGGTVLPGFSVKVADLFGVVDLDAKKSE